MFIIEQVIENSQLFGGVGGGGIGSIEAMLPPLPCPADAVLVEQMAGAGWNNVFYLGTSRN